MPRGIPNAKRDDTGIKYTTFHVPLSLVLIPHSFFTILDLWPQDESKTFRNDLPQVGKPNNLVQKLST